MTAPKKPTTHDSSRCGAVKRQGGGACGRPAGWGTEHVGSGRCKLHGGNNPVKHGRYSQITRPRLKELIEQFGADPDPMNLLPEVVLLRALVQDYIERYDAFTGALIDWHESWKDTGQGKKPQQVVDILSAGKFIADIGGLVDKIHKQRAEGTVTMEAVGHHLEKMGMEVVAAVQEAIADADTRTATLAAIDRRWQSLQFERKPGGKGTEESPGASEAL